MPTPLDAAPRVWRQLAMDVPLSLSGLDLLNPGGEFRHLALEVSLVFLQLANLRQGPL